MWARRFAPYKRAELLIADVDRLARLVGDDSRPLQVVIAGKAHPADGGGKQMMHSILDVIERDGRFTRRMAFIPNYDMDVAAKLVAGADIWLNTPRRYLEASGTSGMKAGNNGALHLTVTDGWANEVDWAGIGWPLEGEDDGADAARIYEYLENEIVPAFYDRSPNSGLPVEWLRRMKRSMPITLAGYSAERMLQEYLDKLYLPLLESQQ